MHSSERTHETYIKPEDVQRNPESHKVTRRVDINLANIALTKTVRTRLDVLADDREKIIDSRPETD